MNFVAIDGEGKNLSDGSHIYTLLAASDGSYVEKQEGLSTLDCLTFLLELRQRHPKATFVGFSINYDINMWLSDLPEYKTEELWVNQQAKIGIEYRLYSIEWIPSKYVTLKRKGKDYAAITVYDVFGFFQASFVKSLEEWQIGTKEQQQRIRAMKEQRGDFASVDSESIRRYCLEECELLVALIQRLDERMQAAGIRLTRYDGAGAAASALLRKERVIEHLADPPDELVPAVMTAYYGGRFEPFLLGEIGDVYDYDLNSAYPWAASQLPSLADAECQKEGSYTDDKWAIWEIEWELPESAIIVPFPLRFRRAIHYSRRGRGFYWSPEVATAREVYGKAIRVMGGYSLHPRRDTLPFAFIQEAYQYRHTLRLNGDLAHKAIKLGLNSLYGKMAQGVGHRDKKGEEKRPTYQNYVYAGLITSLTRARMFEAAMHKPEAVVSIATDGLFTTEPFPLQESKKLGGWELTRYANFLHLQSGVYSGEKQGAKEEERDVRRTRGFEIRELDFELARAVWRAKGVAGVLPYTVSRFVGLGSALQRGDMSRWRRWLTERRTLSLFPERKYPDFCNAPVLRVHPSDTMLVAEQYEPKRRTWLEIADEDGEMMEAYEQP